MSNIRTLSPGERVLTSEASHAPVPEDGKMITSDEVLKTSFMFRALIVVMQFMISAQAGLVNYVEGPVNVQLHQQIPAGTPIQTGPQGHAEILLNPGSFLRVGENSTVILDSVELTQIAVRVVNGIALIESAEVDKHGKDQ